MDIFETAGQVLVEPTAGRRVKTIILDIIYAILFIVCIFMLFCDGKPAGAGGIVILIFLFFGTTIKGKKHMEYMPLEIQLGEDRVIFIYHIFKKKTEIKQIAYEILRNNIERMEYIEEDNVINIYGECAKYNNGMMEIIYEHNVYCDEDIFEIVPYLEKGLNIKIENDENAVR